MKSNNEILLAFGVFLGFITVGLIYSWPLAIYLFEGIPFSYFPDPANWSPKMFQGDHLQAYYHISMLKPALTGQIEWFSNPFEFATDTFVNKSSDYFLPLSLVYIPFSYFSEPLGYNIMILASLGLGGLAMYLWAKLRTGSTIAAIIAGAIFSFAPIRLVELFGGHPAGHAVFLFPLVLYFFDRAVLEKSAFQSALAGVAAFVLSIQYNYFSYFLLMFLMIYIPWRLVPLLHGCYTSAASTRQEITALAKTGAPFALGLLGVVGYMFWFKSQLVGAAAISGGRTMSEVALYSPQLEHFWSLEHGWSTYFGFALLAVPMSLLMVINKDIVVAKRRDIMLFLLVFITTYTLAFGTTLDESIPLYSAFFNYFPYFNYTRVPSKIMIISISCLSMLCAYTAAWSKRKWVAALVIVIAIVAISDYHPKRYIGICRLEVNNSVYEKAANEAQGGYLLNLPIWPGESSWSSLYSYYSLISRTPTINGYTPLVPKEYIDKVFWPLFPLNSGDLVRSHVDKLRELNVELIVFHEEAYPPKVSAYPSSFALASLLNSPWLELVYKEEPMWLFRLLEKPSAKVAAGVTSPIGNLFETEHLNRMNGSAIEDPDALNGISLKGGPFQNKSEHILNAGPYRTFPSGKYKVFYRLKFVGPTGISGPVAKIDVSADFGKMILAERIIFNDDFNTRGKYMDFNLEFNLTPERAWQVEFRTYSLGGAEIAVDYMYVLRADQSDPRIAYEAEDLYYTGKITNDHGASGGKAVLYHPKHDPASRIMPEQGGFPSSMMIQGPRRRFEAGNYMATIRMKTSKVEMTDIIGSIEVISLSESEPIAQNRITMAQLKAAEEYSNVSLAFKLAKRGFVEVRVLFSDKSTLHVDSITINSISNYGK
ncbi:MAG TPA: hypothetical protein QF720_00145 [Nitrospinota bacterium]|nr:hypothetical protein [Nitrospinota bacterium]